MTALPQLRSITTGTIRIAWELVRLPLLAVLTLLAPVVQTLCAALMLLGLLVSFLFKISAVGPHFPLGLMVGVSFGFGLVIVAWHALIALLSRG